MKISLAIITLNEEANLPRCLRSAAGLVDEILVVDSGSVDGTRRIAESFGARVIEQPWLGYVGQKNRLLELVQNEWVLSLDADEEVSPQLRAEIVGLRGSEPGAEVGGFSMPRCVLYEGRWIRHGDWYPDRLVRFFRRAGARFAGGKVHERLEVQGEILPLKGEIFHHSFKDAADHWSRCEKYARLWAESAQESGKRAGAFAPVLRGGWRFFRAYVLKGGFLDGRLGWRIAKYSAGEVYLKYKTLRALSSGGEKRAEEHHPAP